MIYKSHASRTYNIVMNTRKIRLISKKHGVKLDIPANMIKFTSHQFPPFVSSGTFQLDNKQLLAEGLDFFPPPTNTIF